MSKKNGNITKPTIEAKIISLIESKSIEITTKYQLETCEIGSLISYLTYSGIFIVGGFITKIADDHFTYVKPNSATKYYAMYVNVRKMWVDDFDQVEHILNILINNDKQTAEFGINIDNIAIVYNKKSFYVKQSMSTNECELENNSIRMDIQNDQLISRTDFRNLSKMDYDLSASRKKIKMLEYKHNELYELLMNKILNNHLFKYPTSAVNSLADLLIEKQPKPNVYLGIISNPISGYNEAYNKLAAARKQYWSDHKRYYKLKNRIATILQKILNNVNDNDKRHLLTTTFSDLITKYKYCSGTKMPSTGESLVINFLDKLCCSYQKQYTFFYFYSYRWPFCRDKMPLEYDFYCFLTSYKSHGTFQFVIEVDGDQHLEENDMHLFNYIHVHDIMKQHYLYEMNIHLLRLNNGNDIENSIVNFINTMLTSSTYLSVNEIEPIEELFGSRAKHAGLISFNNHHKEMRSKTRFASKKIPSISSKPINPELVLLDATLLILLSYLN